MAELPPELDEVTDQGSVDDGAPDAELALPEGAAAVDGGTVLTSEVVTDEGFGGLELTDHSTQHQEPGIDAARHEVDDAFEDRTAEAATVGEEPKDGRDSAVTRSDTIIAQMALSEAGRLEAIADDPESDASDDERAEMRQAIDRLRSTAGIHAANVPLAEVNELDAHDEYAESNREPVVVQDLPFVDVHEQVGLKTDEQLIQEVENKDHLIEQADLVGDRIRLAAMDKAPESMKKKAEVVDWETTDEGLPGSAYRFSARFEKEGDIPVLRNVSCTYVADSRADKDRGTRLSHFGQNPVTHPVTVMASFDGPRLSELKLEWPNRSRIPATGVHLGPAWRDSVSGDSEGTLAALVKEVETSRRVIGLDGFISMTFGDNATLATGVEDRWNKEPDSKPVRVYRSIAAVNPVIYWLQRLEKNGVMRPPQHLSVHEYVSARDSYIGTGGKGEPRDISADDALKLAGSIGSFFPVMAPKS